MNTPAPFFSIASSVALALTFGCSGGNDLPPTGECVVDGADGIAAPVGEPVDLPGTVTGFDDLGYSSSLGRVLVGPLGAGAAYLVDPESLEVTAISGLPVGSASIADGDGFVFVADRQGSTVVVIDPGAAVVAASFGLGSRPDYVRFAPATHELWVTEPGEGRIEVLSFTASGSPTLAHVSYIDVAGGPEGLVFDGSHGRAYAHASGELAVIDVASRAVTARWPTQCDGSHGIPVVDEARGLVFAGCAAAGGAAVLDQDGGALLAGYEAGTGEALLAYSPALGHFYLRGDPGAQVDVLAVCGDGGMSVLGKATAPQFGHGLVADDRGAVWGCDAQAGQILRFEDLYPAVP
jgi:DNA-binding beta-propeller fold protein YncE